MPIVEAADAAASRWLAAKLGNDEAAELVRQNPQLAEGSPARFARAWTALEDQLGKRRAREVLTKQPRVLSASGASIRVVLPVLVEVLGKDGAKDAVCRNLSLVAPHATSLRAALPAWVEALGKEEAIEAVVRDASLLSMKAAAVRQIVPVLVQELGEEAALEAVRRHPELLTSHSTNFARAMPSMMQALGKRFNSAGQFLDNPANVGETARGSSVRDQKPHSEGERALFEVAAPYALAGDQPVAVGQLEAALRAGQKRILLRGAAGTGKTLVMAHTIARAARPALVLCPNQELAAQMALDLRGYLPNAAVESFPSLYSRHRPEAYSPLADRYTADACEVDPRLRAARHRATRALSERRDVVVVASVSCLRGLGRPREYMQARTRFCLGDAVGHPEALAATLSRLMYTAASSEEAMAAGAAWMGLRSADGDRGDPHFLGSSPSFEACVWPPDEPAPLRLRVDASGVLREIVQRSLSTGGDAQRESVDLYPASHLVSPETRVEQAVAAIEQEMLEQASRLEEAGDCGAAQRLRHRTGRDLTLLRETGHCPGMEIYSQHLQGCAAGSPPTTLMDFMQHAGGSSPVAPDGDWLLFVDESHACLPRVGALHANERARQRALVDHGFRLPSAADHRPISESEFWSAIPQTVFVSATPGDAERDAARQASTEAGGEAVVEMVVRPSGALDPVVEIHPTAQQLPHLLGLLQQMMERRESAIVCTPTQKDAEELAVWLQARDVRAKYLHSTLDTPQRAHLLRMLQRGDLDVLVGVDLLRKGVDVPQVPLVAVLDADRTGALRSARSLMQVVGRHLDGTVAFYADDVSNAAMACISDTQRRRARQELAYARASHVQAEDAQLAAGSVSHTQGVGGAAHVPSPEETSSSSCSCSGPESEDFALDAGELTTGRLACQLDMRTPTRAELNCASCHEGDDAFDRLDVGRADSDARVQRLRKMARDLPDGSGVYMFIGSRGAEDRGINHVEGDLEVLYVGRASSLRSRVQHYVDPREEADGGPGPSRRKRLMMLRASSVDFVLTPGGEVDALLLEAELVRAHRPAFNVRLQDNASFPYICVSTQAKIPQFYVQYSRDQTPSRGTVFGPYADLQELQQLMRAVEGAFGLRTKRIQAKLGEQGGALAAYRDAVDCAVGVLDGEAKFQLWRLRSVGDAEGAAALEHLLQWQRRRSSKLMEALEMDPTTHRSCDVVGVTAESGGSRMVVQLVQIRDSGLARRYCFVVDAPEDSPCEADVGVGLQQVLVEHYSAVPASAVPVELVLPREIPGLSELRLLLENRVEGGKVKIICSGDLSKRKDPNPKGRPKVERAVMKRNTVRKIMALANGYARAELRRLVAARLEADVRLKDLEELLHLTHRPRRIHAFDVYQTPGHDAVITKVVFIDGEPAKHMYSIHKVPMSEDGGTDEFKVIQNAVQWSIAEPKQGKLRSLPKSGFDILGSKDETSEGPDLIVIHGGKRQLSAALRGLEDAGFSGVPCCAHAKDDEHLYLSGQSDAIKPSPSQPALLLLQAVRDESHKYARQSHCRKKTKSSNRRQIF